MNYIDEWIKTEQNKHRLCACGCGQEIKIIARHHQSTGIPKYIKGHSLKMGHKPGERKKGKDNPRYSKVEKTCLCCGIKYTVVLSMSSISKYCSKKCQFIAQRHALEWVKKEQGKHYCNCGCGLEITIKKHHYSVGIPEYIKGHNCKNGNHHMCGVKYTKKHKQKLSKAHIGKMMGIKNYFYGKRFKGDKNSNWKGGISFEPYCSKFNNQLKERIRNRDNRTCQCCGIKENGTKLSIHHIHYDKENCYPDLITVCRSCNTKANTNREYWEKYYMDILETRGLLNWSG